MRTLAAILSALMFLTIIFPFNNASAEPTPEIEPNNTSTDATVASAGTYSGFLDAMDLVSQDYCDYYKLSIKAGQTVFANLTVPSIASGGALPGLVDISILDEYEYSQDYDSVLIDMMVDKRVSVQWTSANEGTPELISYVKVSTSNATCNYTLEIGIARQNDGGKPDYDAGNDWNTEQFLSSGKYSGYVGAGDDIHDGYSIEMSRGRVLNFTVVFPSIPSSGTMPLYYVTVYDANHNTLVRRDITTSRRDPVAVTLITETTFELIDTTKYLAYVSANYGTDSVASDYTFSIIVSDQTEATTNKDAPGTVRYAAMVWAGTIRGHLGCVDGADWYQVKIMAGQTIFTNLTVLMAPPDETNYAVSLNLLDNTSATVYSTNLAATRMGPASASFNYTENSKSSGYIYYIQMTGNFPYTLEIGLMGQNEAGKLNFDAGDDVLVATSIAPGAYSGFLKDRDAEDIYAIDAPLKAGSIIKATLTLPQQNQMMVPGEMSIQIRDNKYALLVRTATVSAPVGGETTEIISWTVESAPGNGTYYIRIANQASAGEYLNVSGAGAYSFTYSVTMPVQDRSPPVITLKLPTENQNFTDPGATFYIIINVTDNVGVSEVYYKLTNIGDYWGPMDKDESGAAYPGIIAKGDYYSITNVGASSREIISFKACDSSGNWAYASVNYTMLPPGGQPYVRIKNPVENEISDDYTFQLEATPDSNVQYQIDGKKSGAVNIVDLMNGKYSLYVTANDYSEGKHTLVVWTEKNGYRSANTQTNFTVIKSANPFGLKIPGLDIPERLCYLIIFIGIISIVGLVAGAAYYRKKNRAEAEVRIRASQQATDHHVRSSPPVMMMPVPMYPQTYQPPPPQSAPYPPASAAPQSPARSEQACSSDFAVEDTFLMYRDGRLIQHTTRTLKADMDVDIMTSMLSAVQSFVKESLGRGEGGELGSMEYGENKILLQKSKHIILAVVICGTEPAGFRPEMKEALSNIEGEYSSILPVWDGDPAKLAGAKKFLTRLGAYKPADGPAAPATGKADVTLASELEFYQGFIRLKVAVKNNSQMVATKVVFKLIFNEDVLRLDSIEPAYNRKGDDILLDTLDPKEKKTVAFYLDPQICTESHIDGNLTYKDATGQFKSITMPRKLASVVCPIMFTEENINTAMLKRMVDEELSKKDSKLFQLPAGLTPEKAFDIGKAAVQHHDARLVREFSEPTPYIAEAWYYGRSKGRDDKMVIRVRVLAEKNILEFFVATGSTLMLTGLLAELKNDLKKESEARRERTGMSQISDGNTMQAVSSVRTLLDRTMESEGKASETEQTRR